MARGHVGVFGRAGFPFKGFNRKPTNLGDRRTTVYASPRLIVQFEMNRRGIARIAMGQQVQDATRAVVRDRALPFAIQNSPVRSGDYISKFEIAEGTTVVAGMRRRATKLVNTSDHAAAVEFINKKGNGNGTRVLGKTIDHLNATGGGPLRGASAPFRAQAHPRGPGGRFIPRNETA